MSEELKACPFCNGGIALTPYGEKEDAEADEEGAPFTQYWMVRHKCAALDLVVYTLCEEPKHNFQKSKADWIAAWNTRSNPATSPGVVGEDEAVEIMEVAYSNAYESGESHEGAIRAAYRALNPLDKPTEA